MKQFIYNTLEEITGIPQEELREIADLDLFENNLLNSLALVTFFNELEEKLDVEIDFSSLGKNDLTTINKIISFVKNM